MKVTRFKGSVKFPNDGFDAEDVKVEIEEDRNNLRLFMDGVLYVSCRKTSKVVRTGRVS